jgi:hypothetical protein
VPADPPGGPAHDDPRESDAWRRPERRRAAVEHAVEEARRRLRDGRRFEAAELLDRCARVLPRHEPDYPQLAERRAYAHDRSTGDGQTSLPPDVLQRVITWLTREELEAGERELADNRPWAAAKRFAAADAIDARGTRAALLQALALQRAARRAEGRATEQNATGQNPAELHKAERYLRRAAALIGRAGTDPVLRKQTDELGARIDAQLAELKEGQAVATRIAAARACLADYNTFVRHYNENPLRSTLDYANFRSSLATLGARINRLRRTCPAESEEGRLLAQLAEGVADMHHELPP